MRIWDLNPKILCKNHLLGEHRELHALWSILTNNKNGYRNHPETKRWVGKLAALYKRHECLVCEMRNRGFRHLSDLDKSQATGEAIQNKLITPIQQQIENLRSKNCTCKLSL